MLPLPNDVIRNIITLLSFEDKNSFLRINKCTYHIQKENLNLQYNALKNFLEDKKLTLEEEKVFFELNIRFVFSALKNNPSITKQSVVNIQYFKEILIKVHTEVLFTPDIATRVTIPLTANQKSFLENCSVETNRRKIFTAVAFTLKAAKAHISHDPKLLLELWQKKPLFAYSWDYSINKDMLDVVDKNTALYIKIIYIHDILRAQLNEKLKVLIHGLVENKSYTWNEGIEAQLDNIVNEEKNYPINDLNFYNAHLKQNEIDDPRNTTLKIIYDINITIPLEITQFFVNNEILLKISDRNIISYLEYFLKYGLNPNDPSFIKLLFLPSKTTSINTEKLYRIKEEEFPLHENFKEIIILLRKSGLVILNPYIMETLLIHLVEKNSHKDNSKKLRIMFFHFYEQEKILMLKTLKYLITSHKQYLFHIKNPLNILQDTLTKLNLLYYWLKNSNIENLKTLTIEQLDIKLQEGLLSAPNLTKNASTYDFLKDSYCEADTIRSLSRDVKIEDFTNKAKPLLSVKVESPRPILPVKEESPVTISTVNEGSQPLISPGNKKKTPSGISWLNKYIFMAEVTFILLGTAFKYTNKNSKVLKISLGFSCIHAALCAAIYTIEKYQKH